ncbi:uncharacterized protein LOC132447911 [Gadus macrocephalus]|uniref:uncharacterized protein LOC132447911 n=1 Tax=Gadus macrocephalus TaxID=80720 RepID=UPI0028CB3812|nr:uncharacterized protein LOC132447911 [Gadus macrocephalus]
MPESHLMGFLVLFFSILRTESTIGILNSINDLKKIPFGQSVPKQSLPLLHFFASTIEFDNNDLIELTFEPSNGDYGTHHYGNYEGVLDRLPPGQQYYTLGNINPMINNNGISLPSYVAGHVNHLLGGEELNRARIIFSLLDQDTIGQVFITQHYEANQGLGTGYDPVHTYRISINLLRELRVFSLDRRQHSELSEIGGNIGSGITDHELSSVRNTWGQLACVGLLLFIVINERNSPCSPNRAREPKRPPKCNVREPKLPPKRNVRQPKLPLKPNVRVLASPPKRNVRASVTPHISVNIPENDINLRPPNQDWDIFQCCYKCWFVFKICGLIVGVAIVISIIIIICKYLP